MPASSCNSSAKKDMRAISATQPYLKEIFILQESLQEKEAPFSSVLLLCASCQALSTLEISCLHLNGRSGIELSVASSRN